MPIGARIISYSTSTFHNTAKGITHVMYINAIFTKYITHANMNILFFAALVCVINGLFSQTQPDIPISA